MRQIMTRRICIVFTLALSFTMMFLSPSIAGEITVKVTVPISETRVPISETNDVEISVEDQSNLQQSRAQCEAKKECRTKNNVVGYWKNLYCCTPCDNLPSSSSPPPEEQ
jgi:uncharacterized protein (DUF58 family)